MKKAIIFLLFMIVSGSASAQFYDKMFFVGWNVNTPLVNKEFVGKSSTSGARLGYREMIREKFAIGVDLTWATFEDYVPRQTYYTSGSALTTDFNNYANNYGALLTGDYYFFTEKKVMPYVGLGAGVAYNSYKKYYNVYTDGDNSVGFMARPTAGVWLKFSERKNWAINAGVHFDFSTAKSKDLGYKNFMNAGFELGLMFLDW
jgi:opacity protein-like surface antigen